MISDRAVLISPFLAMDILEEAQRLEAKGEDVIRLELGQPDFEAPEHVVEAVNRAIREGETKYTHCQGAIELREAISEHYSETYGVEVSPDRIFVNSGTSPAMFLVFGALLNPGDEVILTNPYYPCYPNIISFLGGRPIYLDLRGEEGFRFRTADVGGLISPRTRAILINSPSNPTGLVLGREDLEIIAGNDPVYVVSDEIYHGLVYEGKAHSILELTDQAFVLNGFSKLYGMPGWRLGWVIVPEDFIRPMQKIQQNFFISPNAFVQRAGVAALKGSQDKIEQMVEVYNRRRRYILKRLKEIGFGVAVEPTGAFYVLADARRYGRDSLKLSREILNNAKVAITPGIDFGSNAEGYLRFSYTNTIENIEEAMQRLDRFLNGRDC